MRQRRIKQAKDDENQISGKILFWPSKNVVYVDLFLL
jgi:hypothetical protein